MFGKNAFIRLSTPLSESTLIGLMVFISLVLIAYNLVKQKIVLYVKAGVGLTSTIIILTILSSMVGVTQQGFEQEWLMNELTPMAQRLSDLTGIPEQEVLFEIFGPLHFVHVDTGEPYISCWASLYCYGDLDAPVAHGLLLHELGHRFIQDTNRTGTELANYSLGYYENEKYIHVSGYNPETGKYERTLRGFTSYKNSLEMTYKEDYADMFMSWALNNFTLDKAGQMRYNYINEFIQDRLKELGVNNMFSKELVMEAQRKLEMGYTPTVNGEYQVTEVSISDEWMGQPKTTVTLEKKGLPEMSRGIVDMSFVFGEAFHRSPEDTKKEVKPELTFYNDKKEVVTLKFKDGTVIKVHPTEDDEYSREIGFLEALGRYIYGSRSALVKAIEEGKVQD